MHRALFMARTKTLIRTVATLLRGSRGDVPPHEIIARVNEELCQGNAHGMFVTVFFGMLDPASGELRFCNAGHTVPYVLGPSGAVAPVHGTRAKPEEVLAHVRAFAGTAPQSDDIAALALRRVP